MASAYKKTAKDIAFDKERMKLKSEIAKLCEEVLYWKVSAQKAQESASQFEELYLEAIDHLGIPKEDFEKHLKQTENANNLAELMKITNLIDSY